MLRSLHLIEVESIIAKKKRRTKPIIKQLMLNPIGLNSCHMVKREIQTSHLTG